MNRVSEQLHSLSKKCLSSLQSDEDVEDAEYFESLAQKNDAQNLTIKEAQDIMEMFEEDDVVTIDKNGKRHVDYAITSAAKAAAGPVPWLPNSLQGTFDRFYR